MLNSELRRYCLGMQLLFSEGEEEGKTEGLNFMSGKVKKMEVDKNLKLPHVGWNNLFLKDHIIF